VDNAVANEAPRSLNGTKTSNVSLFLCGEESRSSFRSGGGSLEMAMDRPSE